MIDLTALTNEELAALHRDVLTQIAHRASLATMEADTAATNERYLRATGHEPGQPWERPTGIHDAYPKGWTATHSGELWESLTPLNIKEPGDTGGLQARGATGPSDWAPVEPPVEPEPDPEDDMPEPTGGP